MTPTPPKMRIVTVGTVSKAGGLFGWEFDAAGLKGAVGMHVRATPDGPITLYAGYTIEELREISEEARRDGMRT